MEISKEQWDALQARVETLEKLAGIYKAPVNRQNGLSEEFKSHIQKFFDAFPDADILSIGSIHKSDDGPSTIYTYDCYDCDWEQYENIKKSFGQQESNKWFDALEKFIEDEIGNYDIADGNELYPGEGLSKEITRDFKVVDTPYKC